MEYWGTRIDRAVFYKSFENISIMGINRAKKLFKIKFQLLQEFQPARTCKAIFIRN